MTINLEKLHKTIAPIKKVSLDADKWIDMVSSGSMESMSHKQLKKFLKNASTYIEEYSRFQGYNPFETLLSANTGHFGRRVL